MFKNIYGKRLLFSFRDRETLFWTLLFPLVLATMFSIVFSELDTTGLHNAFPLGVVDDDSFRQDIALSTALESVSGEDGLFILYKFDTASDADTALENDEIRGYIIADNIPTLVVTGNALAETIAKGFLDRFIQTRNSIEYIIAVNPAAANDLSTLLAPVNYTEVITLSHNPPSNMLNYFYALLAMTAMYGAFHGLTSVSYLQANLSALGARRTLSPAKRWKMVFYDLLGGLTIHFASMVIAVAFMSLVLGIDFGSQLGLILLTCFVGSILGISFGAFITSVLKMKEHGKISLLIGVTMFCSFLAGLMVGGLNYIIAEQVPVLAWINPAARITDAFFSLYFYDTFDRFFLNIGVVSGMSVVMFLLTALFIGRQRYESI